MRGVLFQTGINRLLTSYEVVQVSLIVPYMVLHTRGWDNPQTDEKKETTITIYALPDRKRNDNVRKEQEKVGIVAGKVPRVVS